MNKKEIQTIDSIIEAISSIIKGEMPQKIDLKGHDNRKIKELVSTTNRLLESFSEANDFMASLAQGKLNIEVPVRNNLASQFKQLHSNLRHLTWQVQQVAMGDYSQSVDFLGDFSDNFNSMITALKEKKQVEEALRASEEKYSSLFHNSNDGIFIHDLEGNIIDVNQKVLDQFGYTKSEILSIKIHLLHPPEALSESKWAFETITRYGSVNFEIDFTKKNGEVFIAEVSSSLFKIGGKQVVQGIVRDITERKRLEGQLFNAQKMEAIATLAGGIAHQFNNALFAITGNIELLEMDALEDMNINQHVAPMKDSAQRMANLSDQLLAYARGGKYQPKIISMNKFLEDSLPILEHLIDPKIRVETDFSKDVLNIDADLTQMQMVLSAILINASEAIEGEGRIRVITSLGKVDEEFVKHHPGIKPGSYASLTIEDNGSGMDKEARDRIFEPFFTTKFQGRGLGMASAYGIVKNHDGWISVYSEIDKGTTVTIYLPAIKIDKAEPEAPTLDLTKGEGTILLVEDEEMVMEVSRALLERLGYRVLIAQSGKEAIAIAKTFDGDIDLTILDIVLPDMGGKDVYPLLMKTRPNLKVIVCSGYSVEGPAQEILDSGAQGFIQKPFSLEKLSVKLKQVLGE